MKKLLLSIMVLMVSGLAPCRVSWAESVSTAITYQGHLSDGGASADGFYDFVFRVYDVPTGGLQRAMPVTLNYIQVVDGFFTVKLNFAPTFTGEARWLEIDVRLDGIVEYTTLDPRQELTAAPFAHTLRPGAAVIGTETNIPVLKIRNEATTGVDADGLHAETDSTTDSITALLATSPAACPPMPSATI